MLRHRVGDVFLYEGKEWLLSGVDVEGKWILSLRGGEEIKVVEVVNQPDYVSEVFQCGTEPAKLKGMIKEQLFYFEEIERHERDFWNRFPELALDDPEDPLNFLVARLRNAADNHFKEAKETKELLKNNPEQLEKIERSLKGE